MKLALQNFLQKKIVTPTEKQIPVILLSPPIWRNLNLHIYPNFFFSSYLVDKSYCDKQFRVSLLQSDAFKIFSIALDMMLNHMVFTDRIIQKYNEAMFLC